MGLRLVLTKVRRRASEILHCQIGSYHLRRGNLSRARDHFLYVLRDGSASFHARLNLGRVYLKQERLALAIEELQKAKEINPRRFARENLPGDPLLWIAERLPETRPQNIRAPIVGGEGRSSADSVPSGYDPSHEAEPLPFGDFTSRDEAERFSLLPPIALNDSEEIDWDRLSRQLIEDDETL